MKAQSRNGPALESTTLREVVLLRGQCIGLAIQQSLIQVPLWALARFVLGRPEFKSSAMLVNSQLVASCWLGFFNPVMLYMYLNGVPVK